MSRSVPWRRNCPDKVSSRLQRASRVRLYLLRAIGPTGFLITTDRDDDQKFKVLLGDPHSCTCSLFIKERELCVHILWILIKKFKVPKENSVVYQLGLVEREISEVVRGSFANNKTNKETGSNRRYKETDSREKLSKKEITEDDVCPICQEDLRDQIQPTTYCKYGCGNSIHIKCMKIWAEHQRSCGESVIKCPLCRADFGAIEVIRNEYLKSFRHRKRQDIHEGTVCDQCGMSPIAGKCYRCTVCSNCYLCKDCFASESHPDHQFVCRQKSNQPWRLASKFQAIPPAVANDLQSREITDDDYTLLLQLDGLSSEQSSIPENVLNSFPVERIPSDNHRLTKSDKKCGVCFHGYRPSQAVRRLPCKHEFHRHCIDSWLSNEHNTCPIDGQTIYSTFVAGRSLRGSRATESSGSNQKHQNVRQINMASNAGLSSTMFRRQEQQKRSFPQNFSLNGLGLHQRNVETSSEVFKSDRTNSAPAVVQTVQQAESSSKHISFDTNILGRPQLSTEQIVKFGRHSSDIRLRRCLGLTTRNKCEKFSSKCLSLNNISLSGKRMTTCESNDNHPFNDGVNSRSPSSSTKHDPNLISTSLSRASPDTSSYHIPVDI